MSENGYENVRKFTWCQHKKISQKISEFSKFSDILMLSGDFSAILVVCQFLAHQRTLENFPIFWSPFEILKFFPTFSNVTFETLVKNKKIINIDPVTSRQSYFDSTESEFGLIFPSILRWSIKRLIWSHLKIFFSLSE